VVLYNAAGAMMGLGWALTRWTALAGIATAIWLPVAIAVSSPSAWIYWVIYGLRSADSFRSE
jgi:hypothetical protein